MKKLGIVRWMPLAMALAACSADVVTAPAQIDESLLVTASAKGGNANGNGNGNGRWTNGNANLGEVGITEQRVYQIRYYPNADPTQPGIYRMCQLNPLEDADGSDWLRDSGKIHQIEPDAFLLVKEFQAGFGDVDVGPDGIVYPKNLALNYGLPGSGEEKWKLTFLGRAHWTYNAWLSGTGETSRTSSASGVVAPVDASLRAFAETPSNGETGEGGLLQFTRGIDLYNTPMMPGAPWAMRADSLLAATYRDAPQDLRFAVCDAHFYQFVLANDIETHETKIPGGYWDLVPGAR